MRAAACAARSRSSASCCDFFAAFALARTRSSAFRARIWATRSPIGISKRSVGLCV